MARFQEHPPEIGREEYEKHTAKFRDDLRASLAAKRAFTIENDEEQDGETAEKGEGSGDES